MNLTADQRHKIFEATQKVYKEQIEQKAFEIMVQDFDWIDYDPLNLAEHDGTKYLDEGVLRESLKDNMNFKDCAKIHEDAKGVFFWDYMWFLCDEDNTIEKQSSGEDFPNDWAIIFNGWRNFMVHINDGDHLWITCMTHYGDLLANYRKLWFLLNAFNKHKDLKEYSTHPKYGYVN